MDKSKKDISSYHKRWLQNIDLLQTYPSSECTHEYNLCQERCYNSFHFLGANHGGDCQSRPNLQLGRNHLINFKSSNIEFVHD